MLQVGQDGFRSMQDVSHTGDTLAVPRSSKKVMILMQEREMNQLERHKKSNETS
jgi:hypothetical protein